MSGERWEPTASVAAVSTCASAAHTSAATWSERSGPAVRIRQSVYFPRFAGLALGTARQPGGSA